MHCNRGYISINYLWSSIVKPEKENKHNTIKVGSVVFATEVGKEAKIMRKSPCGIKDFHFII